MNESNTTDSMDMKTIPLLQTDLKPESTSRSKRKADSNDNLHKVQALLMQCPTETVERIHVSKEHDMIEDDFEPNRKCSQCKNKTRKRLSDKIAERQKKIHKLGSIDTHKNKTGKQKLKSKKGFGKKQKEKKISDKLVEQNNVIYILDDETKELDKSFLQTIDTITMVSNEDDEDADVDIDADDDIAVDLHDQTKALNGSHTSTFQGAVTVSVDKGKLRSEFYQFKVEPTDSSTGTSYDNVTDISMVRTSTSKMNNEDKSDEGKRSSSNLLFIRHLKDMTTYTENESSEVTPVSYVANLNQVAESAATIYIVNRNDVETRLKSMLQLNRNQTTFEQQKSAKSIVCDQLNNGRIVLPRVDDIRVFNNFRNCLVCRQQLTNLEGLWVAM